MGLLGAPLARLYWDDSGIRSMGPSYQSLGRIQKANPPICAMGVVESKIGELPGKKALRGNSAVEWHTFLLL